jgi:Immunoglobulin domain
MPWHRGMAAVISSIMIRKFLLCLPTHDKVSDWGLQLCRSIRVEVLEPPVIRLEPPSVTLFRGESMRIRCLASQKNRIQERLGYSWTKNHALFHSDPESEMWEDLHPDGSILTIQNVHKSAVYSCSISNSLAPVSASIHVNVMDASSMSICPESVSFGIKWPSTTSGPPVLNDCPISYSGKAQRYCEQRDYNKSIWLTPDFSDCINQKLLRISYEVIPLTAP